MHISLLLQGLPRHGTVTTKKIEKKYKPTEQENTNFRGLIKYLS